MWHLVPVSLPHRIHSRHTTSTYLIYFSPLTTVLRSLSLDPVTSCPDPVKKRKKKKRKKERKKERYTQAERKWSHNNNLRPPPGDTIIAVEGSIDLAYNWRELIGYPSATVGSGVVPVTSSRSSISSNSRYHGDIRENPSLCPCKRPAQQQLSSRISRNLSYDGDYPPPPPSHTHTPLPPRISHLTASLRYRGK